MKNKSFFYFLSSILVLLLALCPVAFADDGSGDGDEDPAPGCGNDETPDCNEESNSPPPPPGGGGGGAPPGPPPPPPCPDDDSEGTSSVKPYRAEKTRQVTDIRTYGAEPILFTRIYRSRTTDFTTNYMDFGWKQTWQHNWNYEAREMTTTTHGKKDIRVRYPNGADYKFYSADGTGTTYAANAFVGDRLYAWEGNMKGFTLVSPRGWEYDFQWVKSPVYKLVQVRDGFGSTWNISHDAANRVRRIENNFGRWLEISRTNLHGRSTISKVATSDGHEVNYEYADWVDAGQTQSVLSSVVYPDNTRAEYTYVGAESLTVGRPLLATADDPMHPGAGAKLKMIYNYDFHLNFGSGPYLVTGIVLEERNLDTDELVVSFPSGAGDCPKVLRGGNVEVVYKYTNGVLIEKRDAEGRPTYYTRDQGGMGYVVGIRDGEGNTTSFIRDYAGRIIAQIDPVGNTNAFTYNEFGSVTSHTDPLGNKTTYTRDESNRVTRVDYPDEAYEEWTYNEYGQYLTHRKKNGGVTTNEYYGPDDPDGHWGDLKSVTDAEGNQTRYAWDSTTGILTLWDALGNATTARYDWRYQLHAITNADQTVRRTQYDEYGNTVRQVDENGAETTFVYDHFNRLEWISDPLGRVTHYEYGHAPGCGGCGSGADVISRITDPAGKVTEFYYDKSDRLTNQVFAVNTPEESSVSWTYDAVGRRSTQTDANGNIHTWVYDAASRVTAETNAAGEVTAYAYDAAGRMTNRVDGNGSMTIFEYDEAGRQTAIESGELRYEYAFDSGGRRTGMWTKANGTITETTAYAYDANDRLLTKTDPTGYVLEYAYNPLGQRSRLNISNVLNITYGYDSRNRLVELSESGHITQIAYDAVGRSTNVLYPNGTSTRSVYDAAGQMLSINHLLPGGVVPLAFTSYTYDFSGNRIAIQDQEGMHEYTYEGHNWLLSAAYPDGTSETFAYDAVGNRTNHFLNTPVGAQQTIYDYGTDNRLLATMSGGVTNYYGYDNIGRLITQAVGTETRTYGYDFQSRMTQLVDTNGSVFAYAFDGEGNRIKQSLNDCLETRFVYDGRNVILELNANNDTVQAYVNNLRIDQPLERISFVNGTPRQRRTFHRDVLGSVVGLSDENGALVQTYGYAAFGAIRTQTGTDLNRITYTAREALGDTSGLYYYRFRTYNPALGRFLSPDPLGFRDGPNRYIYVRNNPLRLLDPFGLESTSDEIASCGSLSFGPDNRLKYAVSAHKMDALIPGPGPGSAVKLRNIKLGLLLDEVIMSTIGNCAGWLYEKLNSEDDTNSNNNEK